MTLTLIGQYDSPFVRRAAIALHHHGVAFRREVLSTFTQFETVRQANPLGKVPVLVFEDGAVLPDSGAIVTYLDLEASPAQRLLPQGHDARAILATEAVAMGLAEKTYERGIEVSRRTPGTQDPAWIVRLERQIASALAWLEARATDLDAARPTRAELAVTVATTFLAEKQPQLFDRVALPNLAAFRDRAEAAPPFSSAPYSAKEAHASGWRPAT